MTCFVDVSQSLSPDTLILSSELMTNGHGGRDEGYAWAQQYGLLLTRVD